MWKNKKYSGEQRSRPTRVSILTSKLSEQTAESSTNKQQTDSRKHKSILDVNPDVYNNAKNMRRLAGRRSTTRN